MNDLQVDVERHFGRERMPRIEELVDHDGYDELEKAEAVKSFGGKSADAVYGYLLHEEPGWTNIKLEEWSCLEPSALRYFLKPYLQYLLHTLGRARPDDEFVSYFHFQLSEVLRIRGHGIFSQEQRALLAKIASEVMARVESNPGFDIWRKDIKKNVNVCLSLLNRA